jgi:orotidine-5'-phosphate decarboxylase
MPNGCARAKSNEPQKRILHDFIGTFRTDQAETQFPVRRPGYRSEQNPAAPAVRRRSGFRLQPGDRRRHGGIRYKPNLAFYEENGAKGWESFVKTVRYIRDNYPEIMIIADAKRGDIGNTSQMYARAFFSQDLADGVTLSPYMGRDTVDPFLRFDGKWAVVLALTSNPSAADFEMQRLEEGGYLYEKVIDVSSGWGTAENMMYVVGATQARMLKGIRELIPNHFLLVPGVGAQGGSLEEVARYGMNDRCGLLVNSSRGIIYADRSELFADTAAKKAAEMAAQMAELLSAHGL